MNGIFIFIFYLIKFCYSIRYNITISNEANKINKDITIFLGQYKTLYANVFIKDNNLDNKDFLTPTDNVISLNNSDGFELLNNNFTIDITEGNIFPFEIGIPCNSKIDLNKSYTIKLISSNENFIIEEFTIKIKNETQDLQLNIYKYRVSTSDSIILYSESKNIKNIDGMYLTFSNILSSHNTSFIISPYEKNKLFVFKFNYSNFNILSNNTCFKNISEISIDRQYYRDNVNISSFEGIFLQNSILSMRVENSTIINSLNISINLDFNYLFLFCSLIDIDKEFPNVTDIISQNESKEYHNFFKFQNYSTEKSFIFFDNLDMYKEYKLKCVFNFTTSKNIQNSLTFGDFPGSNFRIKLKPKYYNNINPTNCINFKFDELNDEEEKNFTNTIINYCNNYCYYAQKIWNKCIKRKFENNLGICVIAKNNNTKDNNFETIFNTFINSINSKEKLKELSISDNITNKFKNYTLENDNEEPKKENYLFSDYSLNNNTIKFKSKNNKNTTSQCYYKLSNKILEEIEFSKNDSYIIINDKLNEYLIDIPSEFNQSDITINLIFQCYNLPNFIYHYLHSSFIVFQIINNKIISSNFDLFPNCNDSKYQYLPQCFNRPLKTSLISINIVNTLPLTIDKSEIINFQKKKDNLYLAINYLKEFINKNEKKIGDFEFRSFLMVSDFLFMLKCRDYINYEYCQKEKQMITEKITNLFNELFPINKPKNKYGFSFKFFSFFYFTLNSDSFSKETTLKLISIIKNIFNYDKSELHFYLEIFVSRIYFSSINNLISSVIFSQLRENNFEFDENNLIKNDIIPLISHLLKKLCGLFIYPSSIRVEKEYFLLFDNYDYTVKVSQNLNTINYLDENVNVTFNAGYKTKSKHYCFVKFKNYPLFNYKKKNEFYNKVYQLSYKEEKNDNKIFSNFPFTYGFRFEFNNNDKKNQYCYYFDYLKDFMENVPSNVRFTSSEVITIRNDKDKNKVSCQSLKFGDVTIGKNNINGIILYENSLGIYNIIIFIILLILLIAIFVILIYKKKKNVEIEKKNATFYSISSMLNEE